MQGAGERKFKLIKFFRIKGESLQEKLKQMKEKIRRMIDWSTVEVNKQIEDRFMLFPNESIYNEGIKISVENQGYNFEMLKRKIEPESGGSIMYQYQNTFFYNNPTKIFKSVGYQENIRTHKNVSVFTSLKYGLQIVIYEKQNEILLTDSFTNTYLEIIQSSSIKPINEQVCFWKIFRNEFHTELIPVGAKDINHQMMTLKITKQSLESVN